MTTVNYNFPKSLDYRFFRINNDDLGCSLRLDAVYPSKTA